jgi:ABC-2 type transport system permease protein
VAAAIGFALSLLLYVISWATAFDSSSMATVLSYLSIVSHFDSFSRGVLDSKDFVFYLSMMFFGLFLTARSLESMRWRA